MLGASAIVTFAKTPGVAPFSSLTVHNISRYASACSKLIGQFRTLTPLVREDVTPDTVRSFTSQYGLDCPLALHRLEIGVPATSEHNIVSGHGHGGMGGDSSAGGMGSQAPVHVAEAVQHFITVMDALKLNMVAKDNVHPIISDLHDSLGRLSHLSGITDTVAMLQQWLVTLGPLQAAEELREEQVRQLLFDVDSHYTLFHKSLTTTVN